MFIYVYESFFQGFGSNNNAEMPIWIQTVMSISHLLVVFNSSVNFYIYLVKLRIKHNTCINCCREEINFLTRRKRDEEIEMRRDWSRKMSIYDINRTSISGIGIPTGNTSPIVDCPDIILSADVH